MFYSFPMTLLLLQKRHPFAILTMHLVLLFFAGACNRSLEQSIQGRVTYDYAPPTALAGNGGKLDFANIVQKPARRVKVMLVAPTGEIIDEVYTNDNGDYKAHTVVNKFNIWVVASTASQSAKPDSIAPDYCNGASWEVEVLDNTNDYALYSAFYKDLNAEDNSTYNINLPLNPAGRTLQDRASAPFAILDAIVTEMETLCQSYPSAEYPPLQVGWSTKNTYSNSYLVENGQISSTHYINYDKPSIYVLGHQDVDTDEFDKHVIAHEFAHYVEDQFYRSDSIGGPHRIVGDSLDARVAFSEGYANAMSAITFQDPIYVDTMGSNNASGVSIEFNNIALAYSNISAMNIYSELAVTYLIWMLYENRDANASNNSGDYSRIGATMSQLANTPLFATLQGFAAHYNSLYGASAENLQTLWTNSLFMPYNSLCAGACIGAGDTPDEIDIDNDIGAAMAPAANYPPTISGQKKSAGFWRLYQALQRGQNVSGEHEQIDISSLSYNMSGVNRLYYLQGDGLPVTVSIVDNSWSCGADLLDLIVYHKGAYIAYDIAMDGCPQVTFSTSAGETYIINAAFGSEYNSINSVYTYTIRAE